MKFLDLYEAKFYQRRLHPGIALPEQNGGCGGVAVRRMPGIRVYGLLKGVKGKQPNEPMRPDQLEEI